MYILELPLLPCERFNNILSQGLLLKTRHILYSFLSDTNRNLLPQCDSSELWTVPQKLDKKRISMNAVQLIRGYYISEIDNSSTRPSISLLFGRKSVWHHGLFGRKSVIFLNYSVEKVYSIAIYSVEKVYQLLIIRWKKCKFARG